MAPIAGEALATGLAEVGKAVAVQEAPKVAGAALATQVEATMGAKGAHAGLVEFKMTVPEMKPPVHTPDVLIVGSDRSLQAVEQVQGQATAYAGIAEKKPAAPVQTGPVEVKPAGAVAGPESENTPLGKEIPQGPQTETSPVMTETTPAATDMRAAELSPQQQRFNQLEEQRKAGKLDKAEDIAEHRKLKKELTRDDRIAELKKKQAEGDGLDDKEADELLGLMDAKDKAEAKPMTEQEKNKAASEALVEKVLTEGKFTTEDLQQLDQLAEASPHTLEATLRAAAENVFKAYREGKKGDKERSKDTKDTEALIQEFAQHMNKYKQKKSEMEAYTKAVENQIKLVDQAEAAMLDAQKKKNDLVESTEVTWAMQMNQLNYLYGDLNAIYVDFGQIETRQDQLFLDISKDMGRINGIKYMFRTLGNSVKNGAANMLSAAQTKMAGKTYGYRKARSST